MKKMLTMMLVVMLIAPACAMAAGASLLMEMPQDAQMVENIEFDDGDSIRTYQLGGGHVQLLRYAGFDMTIEELAYSEYPACSDLRALEIGAVGGYPAAALRFIAQEEEQTALDVTLVCITTEEETLIFKAAFPRTMEQEQIDTLVFGMIATMDVSAGDGEVIDETAEVG